VPTVTLLPGDNRETLRTLADNSVDSVVTDPPYELGFMGRAWDASGIAYQVDLWREVYRVLKSGGHLAAFGGSRTYHRMVCAIEDAGFEIRDSLHWVYGSGFPKSLAVDKALDKAAGAERAVVGPSPNRRASHALKGGVVNKQTSPDSANYCITAPATDLAAQWAGWGTALKPAHEPIVLARKPLAGTVAASVAAWGTGALNIAASRVGTEKRVPGGLSRHSQMFGSNAETGQETGHNPNIGRWPPNVLLQHSALCNGVCHESCAVAALDAQSGERGNNYRGNPRQTPVASHLYRAGFAAQPAGAERGGYSDTGGASRFFPVFTPDPPAPFLYCAKASKRDRTSNGTVENRHCTVKPQALMRWLCTLITPPGGTVLDPFMGSGSTGVAAVTLGYHFIGCEQDAAYMEIARSRIAHAQEQQPAATQPALEMTA
jgi:DNA modification methylase